MEQGSGQCVVMVAAPDVRTDEGGGSRPFGRDEEVTGSGSAPVIIRRLSSPQMCFPDLSNHLAGFL